jgi:hypothetical protein
MAEGRETAGPTRGPAAVGRSREEVAMTQPVTLRIFSDYV